MVVAAWPCGLFLVLISLLLLLSHATATGISGPRSLLELSNVHIITFR